MHNLIQIGIAVGGEAGDRLAGNLGLTAISSTLLRLLHQIESPEVAEPRIIGIDDGVFRKGRDYGTLIVDHEACAVSDRRTRQTAPAYKRSRRKDLDVVSYQQCIFSIKRGGVG